MVKWFQKQTVFAGSAFYRGNWPLRKEEFYFLRSLGTEISENPAGEGIIWSLKLSHPQWGEADLICMRNMPLPPQTLIESDTALIQSEKEALKGCQCALSVYSAGAKQNVLQDRKNGLRYLHLALGEEGIAAVDHISKKFWSKEALDIEMSHDAELDIESLFTLHAVAGEQEGSPLWIHTHGLSEMGYFDFDILNASSSYAGEGYDYLRGIAFQIVEEEAKMGSETRVAGPRSVALVPVAEFLKGSSDDWPEIKLALEENPSEQRAVLCEPRGQNFFTFSKRAYEPAKVFTQPVDERNSVPFSRDASSLMQRRAQATYSLLREVREELAPFGFATLVKLAYGADEKKGDEGLEYLWFNAHELQPDSIDASLLNEPFSIPGMKAGDRGMHPIDRLTDWQIMTPGNGINPRRTADLRYIRENREALEKALRESGAEEPPG
jgi:hypothetical protein